VPEYKISFSTLGCPDWKIPQIVEMAVQAGYDGIELRFVEGEASLWKLVAFQGKALRETCARFEDAKLTISCVDTSCRFDSPDGNERERWVDEGVRMAELAAELRAPGIRVFGDRIQLGVDREATRSWIHDAINRLAERISALGVEVWLETHGDFASAKEVIATVPERDGVGVVWDGASAFVECAERPLHNGKHLEALIRHVHIKDLRRDGTKFIPVLTGEGEFPLAEVHVAMKAMNYVGFLSFEWEKKWHPEIEPPEIALPHFAEWFRDRWQNLDDAAVSGACE
jgi:sugar phosphate isomerase/epimerase